MISKEGYSLKINSRFGDQFLQYIISDTDGFLEVDDFGGENHQKGYEWLMAYLWNIKLKRAFRHGLPKTYVTKNESISKLRGNINPVDYALNRKLGRYRCTYREHSYENVAISLFVEALKIVEKYSFSDKSRGIFNELLTASGGKKRSRRELLDTPHFKNPFYNDFNTLIDLSKQLIQHGGSDFDSENNSSGFLFDISMLFEYFIRKRLIREGYLLIDKFKTIPRISTGSQDGYKRELQPDIVIEHNGGSYVFDVKYKSFDKKYGVKREDLFQLHTYIGQLSNDSKVKGCGFIYPLSEKRWDSLDMDKSSGLITEVIQQNGQAIPFYILFIKIPETEKKSETFISKMNESCTSFLNQFSGFVK